MNLRLVLAFLHLLALAVGTGGLWGRARALHDSLREPENPGAIQRALVGDAWWGVAALLWIVTGVWRLLAATEKSPGYYVGNHAFLAKMALFLTVFVLEIWPMTTLIRWRRHRQAPNARDAGRIEVISYVQCVLVAAIVFAAVSMARGYGSVATTTASAAAAADTLTGLGEPAAPSESETATTTADVELLTREIGMPLAGVDPAKLHSNFNERRGGGARLHHALDIMAARGTPVLSAAKGRVLKLFTSVAGGRMVYAADSSERFILMYAHLDSYAAALSDGSPLERGQAIGTVGSTGNASAAAPHLHFAIARSADVRRWSKGSPIDPLPVLQAATRGASVGAKGDRGVDGGGAARRGPAG